MDGNWFTDLLNMFFTFLDRIVYGLITFLYQLLLYLANLDLFRMSDLSSPDNVITNFSGRVYALLGIFMLFKVSFSILQYMVNPDDFSDKSKGFGKMVTNVLVSLCLIVAVPYIFQLAFEAQGIILKSNFLGHLILGETVSGTNIDEVDMSVNEEMAEDLQFLVYGSFFSVDTTVVGECANGPVLGTKSMAQSEDCLNALAEVFKDVGGEQKLGDFFAAGDADSMARRFDAFGEVVNVKRNNKYAFKYMPVISTIAGGFVAVMLLSFCMDVAVRIIKLGFLEIISPIPIISYMDPKQSGKDGMLGKWSNECLKTYFSLFIRIGIIYFAFFVTDLIANKILSNPTTDLYLNEQQPEGLMAIFVQVMVILGVFFFAKEVPKLIENLIPGMSGAGDLSINPLKKIQGSPLAAGAIGGLVGAGVGGIASAAAAFSASKDEGAGFGQSLRRGLGGGVSGVFRGTKAGALAGVSGVFRGTKAGALAGGKGIISKSADVAGRVGRNAALKTNTTLRQRAGAYARQAVGMQSKKEALDKQIGYHESIQKHASNMEERARSRLAKKHDGYKIAELKKAQLQQQFNQKQDVHTGEFETVIDENGVMRQQEKIISASDSKKYEQYFNEQINALNDEQRNYVAQYIDSDGGIIDEKDYHIGIEKDAMAKEIEENKLQYEDKNGKEISTKNLKNADWSTIKSVGDAAEEKAAKIKNSGEYRDQEILDKNIHSENRQGLFTSHK